MNPKPAFSFDFLNLDFSQLETAPLQYFILHSGVFIGVLAGTFFILGLWFGALTWGRYKKQKKALLAENSELKQEIAGLKRRVAEAAVKPAPREPSPAPEPAPKPDPAPPPTPPAPAPEKPSAPPVFAAAPVASPPPASQPESKPEPEPEVDDHILPPLPLPTAPAAGSTPDPGPTSPVKPAPVATPPAKNLVKAKPRPKSEEMEPMPFLLGPIGTDESEKEAETESEASPESPPAPEPKTGPKPKAEPAPASDSTPAAPESPVPSAAITPPPPPASWKNTRKVKLPLRKPGSLPAAKTEPPPELPPEDEAPPRIVHPVSDDALGSIFMERPNDDDIDDLKQIKGISNILEGQLNQYGIYTYKQVAAWTPEHVREFSARLAFKDRIEREKWVEQAQALAK